MGDPNITVILLIQKKTGATSDESFTGTVPWDRYFYEGLNILISTFCVCVAGFTINKY
jgi:hypothetical protein